MKKVEFKDLYSEPEVCGCAGCVFSDTGFIDCGEVLLNLTGVDCKEEGVIFKRKPKYTKCTRENTQVGDEVSFEDRRYRVDIIYEDGGVVLTYTGNGSIHLIRMIGDCYRKVSSVYK